MNAPKIDAANAPVRQRILLVEDNRAASRGLARLLEFQGYEVTAVNDGASALDVLRTEPPPDFVLTDLQLPDLDGFAVACQARQLVPPPRVALITGWDIHGAPEDFDQWGIDWIFSKPLDVGDLIETLRQPSALERDHRRTG